MNCQHNDIEHLIILDGLGVEWCKHCGAIRRVAYGNAKNGKDVKKGGWKLPKGQQQPMDLIP